jgi:acyl-CoA thioester hydrolase
LVARFDYLHTVSREDIDELGHAGNYHYIRWMQNAAVAHSTANGWPTKRYDELGAGWMVRSHQITYLKPAFEGDELVIKTWVANLRPATSLRRYEICLRDGTLLARAETNWAFVNYARQRAIRIPAAVAECFEIATAPGEGADAPGES